jgi:hypothetical protein
VLSDFGLPEVNVVCCQDAVLRQWQHGLLPLLVDIHCLMSVSESAYLTRLWEIIQSIDRDEDQTIEWSGHVDGKADAISCAGDDRKQPRRKIGTSGVLWFEESHLPRSSHHIGIQTCDLSDDGACILAPFQVFTGEKIRIALPRFWVQVTVVRSQKVTDTCYEIGAMVTAKHDPGLDAFEDLGCVKSASAAT